MPARKAPSSSSASPSPSSSSSSSSLRRSTRVRAPPRSFRPDRSDIPEAYSRMIRDIAKAQADAAHVAIEGSAITALEDALEDVLDRLFDLAATSAKKRGRQTIEEEDLKQATKQIKFSKEEEETTN